MANAEHGAGQNLHEAPQPQRDERAEVDSSRWDKRKAMFAPRRSVQPPAHSADRHAYSVAHEELQRLQSPENKVPYREMVIQKKGESIVLRADKVGDNPIRLAIGNDPTAQDNESRMKLLELHMSETDYGMDWYLTDPEEPDKRLDIPKGEPYLIGRANTDLFGYAGSARYENYRRISREHLTLINKGLVLAISQAKDTPTSSIIQAPEGSILEVTPPDAQE
jgi:hypothetical protein